MEQGQQWKSMPVGNAMVGQSGGPTAAINATLSGVIRGVLQHASHVKTLYGTRNGIEGVLRGELIDLTARFFHDPDALALLEQTPAAALGSCRKKLPDPSCQAEEYQKIFSVFEQYHIRYFFYIGGNDSMDTVAKLNIYAARHGYPICVIGVPKTIDNDVLDTDHTPGFGSAAKYIAVSMQEILRDCHVYTTPAVTIVEIMGRDAGWLTAAAALPTRLCGRGPDLIYLPERPFVYEQFFRDIRSALSQHPDVVVAVSEGVRLDDGTYVGASSQNGVVDVFGHHYLAGTGKTLEHAVKREFGCKVRSIELSVLQRCAAHLNSRTDIEESVRIGQAAVLYAIDGGASGQMMGFARHLSEPYMVDIVPHAISEVANRLRCVPDEYINDTGNGVTDACLDYLQPLIEGECMHRWKNGLPLHLEL